MAKWVVTSKRADFDAIGKKYGIDPVLARIIRNRDVIEDADIEKYLQGTLENLYAPELLMGINEAAELIKRLIEKQKKIRIIGDYDVDGICATYILMKGLSFAGAQVDYAIPHRVKDGYGLNETLIQNALEDGKEAIITCDNGISAKEPIAYAKENGMTVIVTDHHEVPFEEMNGTKEYILPDADVVVDPKQPGDTYPNSGICGAVVAYKLVQILCPGAKELHEELLEIAAIATVGDVMELLDENRIIVKEGLKRLEKTKNAGLKALLQVNGLWGKKVTAYHVGFVIGPCINATGRLDAADHALELLLCEEEAAAVSLANYLKDLNDSRKSMTEKYVKEAIETVDSNQNTDDVLVVYLPECHESLAGIIAGRIREKYYRPTFVLTKAEDGLKGSGRSIPGYHMFEALVEVKDLLSKFGGHSMAAGLSLNEENLQEFVRLLNENCRLTEEELEQKVVIDVPMPFSYCSLAITRALEALEPFGNGNEKPVFAQRNIKICSEQILGKNRNTAKYIVQDEAGHRYEMMYFGDIAGFDEMRNQNPDALIHVVYYPSVNEYMGRQTLQFVMREYAFVNA